MKIPFGEVKMIKRNIIKNHYKIEIIMKKIMKIMMKE